MGQASQQAFYQIEIREKTVAGTGTGKDGNKDTKKIYKVTKEYIPSRVNGNNLGKIINKSLCEKQFSFRDLFKLSGKSEDDINKFTNYNYINIYQIGFENNVLKFVLMNNTNEEEIGVNLNNILKNYGSEKDYEMVTSYFKKDYKLGIVSLTKDADNTEVGKTDESGKPKIVNWLRVNIDDIFVGLIKKAATKEAFGKNSELYDFFYADNYPMYMNKNEKGKGLVTYEYQEDPKKFLAAISVDLVGLRNRSFSARNNYIEFLDEEVWNKNSILYTVTIYYCTTDDFGNIPDDVQSQLNTSTTEDEVSKIKGISSETIYVKIGKDCKIHRLVKITGIDYNNSSDLKYFKLYNAGGGLSNGDLTVFPYLGSMNGEIIGSCKLLTSDDILDERYKLYKELINKYTIVDKNHNRITYNKKANPIKLLDEEHFYNIPAGTSPSIRLSFGTGRKENGETIYGTELSTENCPFIKSLKVEDKGVKNITLVLWDKDFGSYYSQGKSLEMMIRNALALNTTVSKNTEMGTLESKEDVNSENYIDFRTMNNSQTDNLKVTFGFADYNQKWYELTDEYRKNQYSNSNGHSTRTNRGWEIKNPKNIGNDTNGYCFDLWAEQDGKINAWDGNDTSKTMPINYITYESNDTIQRYQQVIKSPDSTTVSTYETEYMITGFKTSFTESGVEYEIKAVESKVQKTISQSIVQRYEEISGTPSMVLYTLMRLFNETINGTKVDSKVRIFWADSENIYEEIDMESYKNSKEVPKESSCLTHNKKITISLGSQEAYYNYNKLVGNNKPHAISYKSVAQLINEFCAACPPLKEVQRENVTYTNSSGTTETIETSTGSATRPLEWETVEVKGDTCILLHYRRPIKAECIRNYNWGPGSIGNTVIKSLSIENGNEFAVLSAVSTFDKSSRDERVKIYNSNEGTDETKGKDEKNKSESKQDVRLADSMAGFFVNRVTDSVSDNATAIALSNCLYKGTITIPGDPFYCFDAIMQASSYPIHLNVQVPISEFERKTQQNSDITFDGGTTFANGYRKHYMSGYYIVTGITHTISASGYVTQLEIMSYPGLAYEIDSNVKESVKEKVK